MNPVMGSGRPNLPDARRRRVPTRPPCRRLVSRIPSITRTVWDLGAGERLVGRSGYCTGPAAGVAGLPSVVGPKTVDPDAVAALEPDLVLADRDENARTRVEALEERGLRVHLALLPDAPYAFCTAEARALEAATGVPGLCLPGPWLTWYGCRSASAIRSLRAILGTGGAAPRNPVRDPEEGSCPPRATS